ncbi:carboxymuconolactone decarboxylase family protein [Arthrobacter roseus]|uniref:carboxymuconolactone decarboxylase family protein n=1 Tax=Arthrobacter roseus TaxID=136274 RepID=UPI0019640F91|nr:carboxymuconolactone decarboxylase family protein [Arthrobacter roseus]MBM7847804.1 AhpD family alkylhydroperoxidase [Arthrobacter roseus]
MSNRVQIDKQGAAANRSLVALSTTVEEAAAAVNIGPAFMELIRLRVSQLNGCAFCLRTHTRAAVDAGEDVDRLAVLSSWRETEYFTERESAALELAEAVTLVSHGPISEDVYTRVAQTLSEAEISAVSWIAIVMNAFNRVRITNRQPVGPSD